MAHLPDCPADAAWPEKRWVGQSFSRAASSYDPVAALQRQVGEELLGRLRQTALAPRVILDAGAGTGFCTAQLAGIYPAASLLALDIAEGMLAALKARPGLGGNSLHICGDCETLPLRDGSVDLVFSNLALQWCADLPGVLAEFRRVLRPGGLLAFSSFGPATLGELREAWAKADSYSHVNAFMSRESVGLALAHGDFREFHVRGELRRLAYPDVIALLKELKGLGAHNVTTNRPRHLTGKGVFRKMLDAYGATLSDGRIEASFEIIYGLARLAGGPE